MLSLIESFLGHSQLIAEIMFVEKKKTLKSSKVKSSANLTIQTFETIFCFALKKKKIV